MAKSTQQDEKGKDSHEMGSAKLFVAAIDFGTTYSGYAFSARNSPETLYTCEWRNNNLLSRKAPTSVLIDEDNQFVAFGFDAENKFMASLEDDSDSDSDSDNSDKNKSKSKDVFRYFSRFKMELHDKAVNLKTFIKDQNGVEMKAIDIFAFAIRYLKDQAIGKLITSLKKVETKDIHYVLTVPAIWDDQSKIFMRNAAEQVQITRKHCTSVPDAIQKSIYKESVSCKGQKLCVKPRHFGLFKSTIDSIIKHVDKLLKHPNLSDLHHIIMVGGFSECELVQTAMRQKFPSKKIIIPDEAGLAVLRGAVLFGHQPKIIGKRILRKTYGIQSWPEWDAELHSDTKKCELMELIVAKMSFINLLSKGKKLKTAILLDK
ncbi:unnamed protein product [Mytilus edulis]|uniref:Uncharacterized protein n=1 Tax=Mytilus edulis TaxID=6550 RepID=A0A8S3S401_MYTED|nr:unnamed protein product [Mytilus edulis]